MDILNKIKIIVPAEYTESVARTIFALEEGVFTKIICGASNTNEKQVERLAFIYALSGVNVIDVAPDQKIIQAAKTGITKACELHNQSRKIFPDFKEPVLMVSLNSGDDLHFRKAEINYEKCTNCFECINSCPSRALYSENNLLKLNKNNCVGCGRCSETCLQDAIMFTKINNSSDINFEEIKAVEIHTGNNSIKEVKSFLNSNLSSLKNIELLSFCVESKRFNPTELQDYAYSLTNLINQKVIIQIDGIPMGATDKPFSSLQALSAAAILLESKLNAYIQLSGGTNHLTKKLVKQLGLKISGIGYGTFARKIILSYIEELDDDKFNEQLQRIVNITTSLVVN